MEWKNSDSIMAIKLDNEFDIVTTFHEILIRMIRFIQYLFLNMLYHFHICCYAVWIFGVWSNNIF